MSTQRIEAGRTRRSGLLLALALGAALAALVALAGVAGAASNNDSAEGKGEVPLGKFDFKAHDLDIDPATDDAKGSFSFVGTPSVKGKVTCLQVNGQYAVISGTIEKSSSPAYEGGAFLVLVTDSANAADVDRLDVTFYSVGTQPLCPPPRGGSVPLQKGKIVVHDAV